MRIVEVINKIKNKDNFLFISILLLYELIMYLFTPILAENIKIITFGIIVLLLFIYICHLLKSKNFSSNDFIKLIIIIGILIRTMYVIYTPINVRQHDVEDYDGTGHLGYIRVLYETGRLPKTRDWQFYHPPLFHLMGSTWLHINDFFEIPLEQSLEGIQFISLFFSSMTLLVFYKIINYLKISDKYKILINMFLAFYPTLIIFSGSINNDCLLLFLQSLTILYLFKFNENMSYKNTCLLALSIGFAAMTKISGVIIAIAIMYIFFQKLMISLKEKSLLPFIKKMIVFALIALPIGLWYQVRLIILFKNISIPASGGMLDVSNFSTFQRFLSISFKQIFDEIYCVLPGDYNIFAYIVKSSIFGEYRYNMNETFAFFILLLNYLFIILSIFITIYYLYKMIRNKNNIFIDIMLIIWVSCIVGYMYFNMKYPAICTMDYRYIPLTSFTGILLICYFMYEHKFTKFNYCTELLTIIMSLGFATMFFLI